MTPPRKSMVPSDVIAAPKRIEGSLAALLAELGEEKSFERAKHGEWRLKVRLRRDGTITATLFDRVNQHVEGLDRHSREQPDGRGGRLPAGYHWDRPGNYREPAQQYGTAAEAMDAVCKAWNIHLDDEPQGDLWT